MNAPTNTGRLIAADAHDIHELGDLARIAEHFRSEGELDHTLFELEQIAKRATDLARRIRNRKAQR